MSKLLVLCTVTLTLWLAGCGGADRPATAKVDATAPAATPVPAQASPPVAQAEPETVDANPVVTPTREEARMDGPKVFVNGRALTPAQLDAFKQIYGVIPAPGHWWYDATSGMYGAEGQGAAGFMYPGHDLGPLNANVSHGDRPVKSNRASFVFLDHTRSMDTERALSRNCGMRKSQRVPLSIVLALGSAAG